MSAVHAAVSEIFTACPELYGFSIQGAEELTLAHVATAPYASAEQVVGEISAVLVELIDEHPEAADELRGRTFARTLH